MTLTYAAPGQFRLAQEVTHLYAAPARSIQVSPGGVCVAAATATGPNQSVLTKKTSGEKLRKTNTLVDVLVCSVILKNV